MTSRSLALTRPIVAFDLETTGLSVTEDRIVEISCVKIQPEGQREIKTWRVNPGRPISAEATRVHGIQDADVAASPPFAAIAAAIADLLSGCDLTGFNLTQFDLPMLSREFARVEMKFPGPGVHIVDSRKIFMFKEPRNLAAAYTFYCDKILHDAHSAEADALAAADILLAQVERYPDLPTDVAALDTFCHPHNPDWIDPDGRIKWLDNEAVLTFGKHRHRPLRQLVDKERGYLEWILKADFSPAVIEVVRAALAGDFPRR